MFGSEITAFADTIDMAFTINHDSQLIIESYILLSMMRDRISLFDIITRL